MGKVQSQSKKSRPNVFEYHDYVSFLKDWFAYKKTTERKFSVRKFGLRCDLSQSYLSYVMSGKVQLSEKSFARIKPHLEMEEDELSYLNELRVMATSKTTERKARSLSQLQQSSSYKKRHEREVDVSTYLTNWYNVAIKEMASLPGFKLDPKWIQKQLKKRVPIEQIQDSIRFLQEKGFISKGVSGESAEAKDLYECDSEVLKIALSKYHSDVFSLADHSIHHTSRDKRQIDALTLRIPEEKFSKMKAILHNALNKLAELDEGDQRSNSVYQVSVASFPLAVLDEDKE